MAIGAALLSGVIVTVVLLHTVESTCTSTGSGCITASASSCLNLPDGDYQACEDCTVYHSCSGGVNWANRPCPLTNRLGLRGRLVWKQLAVRGQGICDYTSNTCTECASSGSSGGDISNPGSGGGGSSVGVCTSTGTGCINASSSCRNLLDGDYQACEGCTFYHSCAAGVNWANRPCPQTNQGGLRGLLVWRRTGPNSGYCDYSSSTCTECVSTASPGGPTGVCTSTGTGCITASSTSCRASGISLPDGDYQACEGCTFYHSCSGGVNWANRPCPQTNQGGLRGLLVWRRTGPNSGYCDYSSPTCTECVSGPLKRDFDTPDVIGLDTRSSCNTGTASGTFCITSAVDSCVGLGYGDFQACESCTVYHSCYEDVTYANRRCPAGLVWVTDSYGNGHCDWSSHTCSTCPP